MQFSCSSYKGHRPHLFPILVILAFAWTTWTTDFAFELKSKTASVSLLTGEMTSSIKVLFSYYVRTYLKKKKMHVSEFAFPHTNIFVNWTQLLQDTLYRVSKNFAQIWKKNYGKTIFSKNFIFRSIFKHSHPNCKKKNSWNQRFFQCFWNLLLRAPCTTSANIIIQP